MKRSNTTVTTVRRLAAAAAGSLVLCCAVAQSLQDGSATQGVSRVDPATTKNSRRTSGSHTRYQPNRFAGRAGTYYRVVWGVDGLAVKWAESGELIRFSYRVVDEDRARALNDKKSEPALIAPRAGVSLAVPAMENVGQLRQSGDAEEGKSYWMAFSNKGRLVKRGDRVNIVIGQFRADGLVVD